MSSAHVDSISRVRDFRVALLRFQDEAEAALELLQLEVQRVLAWVDQDRPAYWTSEVRRAFDRVAATRAALNTCRMRTVAGRRPSCIEEQQAHEAARRRLQHCQDQTQRVKQWALKLHDATDEFRGRLAGLRRTLDADVPSTAALLDRTLTALEAYAEVAAPPEESASAKPET